MTAGWERQYDALAGYLHGLLGFNPLEVDWSDSVRAAIRSESKYQAALAADRQLPKMGVTCWKNDPRLATVLARTPELCGRLATQSGQDLVGRLRTFQRLGYDISGSWDGVLAGQPLPPNVLGKAEPYAQLPYARVANVYRPVTSKSRARQGAIVEAALFGDCNKTIATVAGIKSATGSTQVCQHLQGGVYVLLRSLSQRAEAFLVDRNRNHGFFYPQHLPDAFACFVSELLPIAPYLGDRKRTLQSTRARLRKEILTIGRDPKHFRGRFLIGSRCLKWAYLQL